MPGTAIYNVEKVLVQFCFFAPLLFLLIYTIRTPWWKTVAGRSLAALAFTFITVLLRTELIIWGVLPPREAQQPDLLAWLSVACLGLAPIAFLTLTWFLARQPVRRWWYWLRTQDNGNPLTTDAAANLSDFERRARGTASTPEGSDTA